MFAKIQDGELIQAPRYIKYDGYVYHNPSEEICIANGYYPVIESPYPEEDSKFYEPHYEVINGEIIQTWVECELLPPDINQE